MRRNSANPESSLELLLDTICNTLGGVLFLAILVAVLLRLSGDGQPSRETESVSSAELLAEQARLEKLISQIRELEAALQAQQAFQRQFEDAEADRLLRELKGLQAKRDQLVRTQLEMVVSFRQTCKT